MKIIIVLLSSVLFVGCHESREMDRIEERRMVDNESIQRTIVSRQMILWGLCAKYGKGDSRSIDLLNGKIWLLKENGVYSKMLYQGDPPTLIYEAIVKFGKNGVLEMYIPQGEDDDSYYWSCLKIDGNGNFRLRIKGATSRTA